MPKKLVTPATPKILVPSLNRRQILGGLGALALPVLGCSGDDGDGGPVGVSGAPGSGGSGPGGSGVGGGAAGSGTPLGVSGGGTTGGGLAGSPGVGGQLPVGGSGPAPAGAPSGGSGNIAGSGITGGTSPGGASGAAGGASGGSGGGALAGAGGAGGGGGGSGNFLPIPEWASVPACTQSKTDGAGQGPFFIHELEKNDDVPMLRQDLRGRHHMDAEPGLEFQFHLRFLTVGSCNTPIPDVEVYIWNTDGQGYYSGFGLDGTDTEQKPDVTYNGRPNSNNLQNTERFCRGYQLTDANGVVSFKTIFPGWYNGRDVHTHLVVLKKGSMARATRGSYGQADGQIFTTQIYYDTEMTRTIHTSYQPYKRRTEGSLKTPWEGAITAGEQSMQSGIRVVPTIETGDIVRGQVQIIIDPTKSVGGTGG